MADELLTLRDTLARVVPRWLRSGLAQKILYSIGIQLDSLYELATDAVKARFPGHPRQDPSALALVGDERRIRRGPAEDPSHYAGRLIDWWDKHKHRGLPYALLEQVGRYWDTPSATFQIDLVYEMGQRFVRAFGVVFGPQDGVTPLSGPYDADVTHWARWWLVFEWPNPIGDDGLWSSPGTWDDGGTWDTTLSPAQVDELRLVPAEWNNAHCRGHVVLLSGGAELWDVPAGTWADPGVWGGATGTLTLAVD